MSHAVYAGSFDPITLGHLDIVEQALKVFDRVTIAIGVNSTKKRAFNTLTAQALIRTSLEMRDWTERVSVSEFDGALVHFAANIGASAIMRGLRQVSDFNSEFTLHGINERATVIPQVYFICRHEFLHVSSSSAKEMARLGLDVSWLVDPHVTAALLPEG